MVGQFSYLKIFLIDVRENNFKFRGNFKKGKFILKNKILGFLFRAILPKKIKAKMLRKAFQKAPTVDCGIFAEAKKGNRAMHNSIKQNREIGSAINLDDFKETLNADNEAMAVMKGIFAEAKPVQVKGLYDPPPQNAKKGIFTEFMEKSGRAIDDEEMIIHSDLV